MRLLDCERCVKSAADRAFREIGIRGDLRVGEDDAPPVLLAEADHLLVKTVIAARRTCSVARPSQYIPFELLVTRELTQGTIGV